MNVLLFIVTVFLSVISAREVIQLDSSNFDSVVDGSRNVLVKFEASWCGPCKRIKPILSQIAHDTFPDLNGDTVIAAVDVDADGDIADLFKVESLPTLKLFLKGQSQQQSIEFTGGLNMQNIQEFIRDRVNANLQSLPEELRLSRPQIPLTKILAKLTHPGPSTPINPHNEHLFASGHIKLDVPILKSLKVEDQKKNKLKKTKKRSGKAVHDRNNEQDFLPLVTADQAKQIISTAGSTPVILIFFSFSTNK